MVFGKDIAISTGQRLTLYRTELRVRLTSSTEAADA
jgi:hypothetical protein